MASFQHWQAVLAQCPCIARDGLDPAADPRCALVDWGDQAAATKQLKTELSRAERYWRAVQTATTSAEIPLSSISRAVDDFCKGAVGVMDAVQLRRAGLREVS